MKGAILLVLFLGAVQADQVRHVRRVMPTNPKLTWGEWQEIMSNQEVKEEENPEFEGTEPQPADAGVTHANVHSRIIHGDKAGRGEIPWQAAVNAEHVGLCGGSLISSSFVITAAHCTSGISTFTITLGSTSISTSQTGAITQSTRNKIEHSRFNWTTLDNDISLLKLITPVSSSTYISPVRLPTASQAGQDFAGSSVRVSGWGATNMTSEYSDDLNVVDVTVITNMECAPAFGPLVAPSKICTRGVDGKSACHGDSGGPLVLQESDGRYTQIGIVSFGTNDCLPTEPAVYTRVTSFLDWISSNTNIAIIP